MTSDEVRRGPLGLVPVCGLAPPASLEDETGLTNLGGRPQVWERYRHTARACQSSAWPVV